MTGSNVNGDGGRLMKRTTSVVVGLGLLMALALGLIGCSAPCDCPDDSTSYIKPPPLITEEDIQRGREELSAYGGVGPPGQCALAAEHDWDELKLEMSRATGAIPSRTGGTDEERRAFDDAVFSATHSDAWGEWLADQRGSKNGDLPTTVLEVIWLGTLTNERTGRVMQALCES